MTPFQTFGQTAAPSNMMFPTASYLQAAQSAADTRARGMSEIGRGLAGGIDKAMNLMEAHKEEQAKFDATKKMYSAFKNYLPEESRSKIDEMLSDTSMSVKEKNQLAPLLMSMISQGQQQAGRERIANIMADSRENVAGLKNRQPAERPVFDVQNPKSIFNTPVGNPAGQRPISGMPMNPPAAREVPMTRTVSSGPQARQNPVSGVMEFFDPKIRRWVQEPDQQVDDLYFDPTNLGLR